MTYISVHVNTRRPSRPEKRASKSTRKHFNGKRATQISNLHKQLNIGWFPLLLDTSILTQLWSNCCTDKRRAGQLYDKLNAVHVWLSPLPSQGSKEDQAICEQHSELAVKYPLMHAAVNFKDFQYSKASIGKHGKGRYSWLEVWSLPADNSSATPKKATSYSDGAPYSTWGLWLWISSETVGLDSGRQPNYCTGNCCPCSTQNWQVVTPSCLISLLLWRPWGRCKPLNPLACQYCTDTLGQSHWSTHHDVCLTGLLSWNTIWTARMQEQSPVI